MKINIVPDKMKYHPYGTLKKRKQLMKKDFFQYILDIMIIFLVIIVTIYISILTYDIFIKPEDHKIINYYIVDVDKDNYINIDNVDPKDITDLDSITDEELKKFGFTAYM